MESEYALARGGQGEARRIGLSLFVGREGKGGKATNAYFLGSLRIAPRGRKGEEKSDFRIRLNIRGEKKEKRRRAAGSFWLSQEGDFGRA